MKNMTNIIDGYVTNILLETQTKHESISIKYCRIKETLCTYTTDFGYCKFTACCKRDDEIRSDIQINE